MTFALNQFATVKLTNVNPRIEKHGTASVPAVDLNFTLMAANDILDHFDSSLREVLYAEPTTEQTEQQELDGVEAVAALTVMRFPKINPIKWDSKHAGYALAIDYGLGGDSALEIDGCEVGKFVLDLKEGGTVEVKFQVQCNSGLTEQIMGKLALMMGQEVQIMLTAPDPAQVQTIENPQDCQPEPDEPLTAEEIFISTSVPTVQ